MKKMAESCLKCIEVLTAWAEELETEPLAFQKLVEIHPVEPYKSWDIEGRGGIKLRTYAYRCPRCGNTWRKTRRI